MFYYDAIQEKDIPDREVVRKLSEHFCKEKESAVRVIILSIFADIGMLLGINSQVSQITLPYIQCVTPSHVFVLTVHTAHNR